jgi:hypothetical protein
VKFGPCVILAFLLSASAFAGAEGPLRPATGTAAEAEAQTQECVSYTRALEKAGEIACITGKVVDVHTTRTGTMHLNFCRDYRDCDFSVVVLAGDARHMGNIRALQGREIRITGKVTRYGHGAEILWRKPEQVLVALDDEKPKKK